MKRFISVILCLMLMLVCGCSKEIETPEPPATETEQQVEQNEGDSGEVTPVQTLEPSTNKEVVTEADAPKVYWTMDIAYHLETCPELSEKDNTLVTWQMVKDVGLRQCPVCNPPQYEDYIDIE